MKSRLSLATIMHTVQKHKPQSNEYTSMVKRFVVAFYRACSARYCFTNSVCPFANRLSVQMDISSFVFDANHSSF